MIKSKLLLIAGSLLTLASANAQLVHRYDMNNANDSAGASNGTLQGGATLGGGVLTVTGANNGTGTGATSGTLAQSLALPSSVGTGITGNFSIEFYATRAITATDFSTVFSFSTAQTNFLLFNPARGNDNGGTNSNFRQPSINGGNEFNLRANPTTGLFADSAQHDVVLTYDATSGTANIYNNGALFATGNPGVGFNFQTAAGGPFNGIGGNAPYGDPSFNGTIADFRIYSQALTQTQVTSLRNIAGGADASNAAITAVLVPEPSAWTAALVGIVGLLGLQRFRRSVA